MKNKRQLAATLLLLCTNYPPSNAFAQGSLMPPDAPAPAMKTLAQIEPRTPISSAPFIILQSGSYYLTTNLTVSAGNGITVAANGVTLNLNGFTISSTAPAGGTGYGILLTNTLSDITILNGHIRGGVTNNGGVYSGPGFAYGIYFNGLPPENVLVSHVTVSGCLSEGIFLQTGEATVVEFCTVHTVGGYGINASTVRNSVATDCGADAISGDQISDCRGKSTHGYGVNGNYAVQNCYGESMGTLTALRGLTAQNCYGNATGGGVGISAQNAINCDGHSVSGYGLFAGSSASNCSGFSSTGTGLYAYNASYCYGSRSGGTAIQAIIATGCIAAVGTNSITYKYNMP